MILITAPVICVYIASFVRPVDCSSRSKQNCAKMPNEKIRQIDA